MGPAEREAVLRVIDSGVLSGFYGSPGDEFYGGPEVIEFERAWADRYRINHAVSVNSATSGLIAAMAAIGIGPGDEVIVPPWTMSATAIAPLFYGGIPVFVDIEDKTFCLDPDRVLDAITPRTKAILVVNLFGHPAQLNRLRSIADKHGVWLIEDSAQAPLASEDGVPCGTVGDIGVFSLNFHKHVHTGEGGICVTSNDLLAKRLQMVRNHGENAVDWLGIEDLTNLIGFNFRLTELSAAIGRAQLERIDEHVERREAIGTALSDGLNGLCGITPPVVRKGCRHNYYCWVIRYDEKEIGVDRDTFSAALTAEGFPNSVGYVPPLYSLPVFQRRTAIGGAGFPFNLTDRRYDAGLCPTTEILHDSQALFFEPCTYAFTARDVQLLIEAFRKVHRHREELHSASRSGVKVNA